ncbi:MAG: hypothetical protein HQK98_00385 [Nitrospirae bacterium]|nr:hypothetical protein [Nitrospirota bacterium]
MDVMQFSLWAVVVVCSAPILIQLARMIGSLIELIRTTSGSLRDFANEVVLTVKTANRILATVDDMVVGVKELLSSLKELSAGAKKLGGTLKESSQYITKLLGQTTGLIALVKSTIGIFTKGVIKKGGHDDKE